MQYPHLFSPFTIKHTTFKNRIFCAPLTTDRIAIDGVPTDQAINAYENRARGGVAQVTVTETAVDYDRASRHDHAFNFVREDKSHYHHNALSIVAEGIKVHGAVASVQFAHVGALNHPYFTHGKNPIGPVGYVREDGVTVEQMDEAMMSEVADHFAEAAWQAKYHGFDMVMIHGGHGWIFSQFLSPLTNTRTDEYGGSMANRARFPIMVLDRIRARCGEDFLIEYRHSAEELVPGGLTIDDTIEFLGYVKDKIDILNCSVGIYHKPVETRTFPSMFHKSGCNAELSAAIKRAYPELPVAVVGGINDPALAEEIIASGKADFVALGRQMLADPEFAVKAMTGRADEIAPCLRCSCFVPLPVDPFARSTKNAPRPFECSVNPRSLRELRIQTYPAPRASRRVLVVGGGPAGMYAALTAAERGHRVTLMERGDRLGGLLNFTEHDVYKHDLNRYMKSLIVRVERSGVDVRLNTEVTREIIEAEAPYLVIAAVGSRPALPTYIPGAVEYGLRALDTYYEPEKVGRRVVMIGGGLVGCETALDLVAKGHSVTLVEMQAELAPDALPAHKLALLPKLEAELAGIHTGLRCTAVQPDGVRAVDGAGEERFFPADTVVYAVGMQANADIVEALRGATTAFVAVGDCVRPQKVLQATRDGFFAAMDIL